MNEKLSCELSPLRSLCAVVVIAVMAGNLLAEDLLKKNTAQYLGWRTGRDQFTTCNQKLLAIGQGKIESTNQKCETNPPPPTFGTGKLKNVDSENWTVEIVSDDGKSAKFFYPEISQKEVREKLEGVARSNTQVFYKSPVQGRAETITTTRPKS
jgi:hypothetical protein